MIRTRTAPAVDWLVVTASPVSMSVGFGFTRVANAQWLANTIFKSDGLVMRDGTKFCSGILLGDGVMSA